MIPIKLSVAGFLSYKQPVTLDFTQFDLACISGANGAGKSSLLDAITWVLFGQARKRDESIINTACDKAEVTLDFTYENNIYRVYRINERGKSTSVDFFIFNPTGNNGEGEWKTLSERTMRDTDALIVRTLRLDYETFINASFFLQGKADRFATQKASDRKKILGSILGLDIWEAYKEQTAQLRKDHEAEIKALDAKILEIDEELDKESERKKILQDLENKLAELTKQRQFQEKSLQDTRDLYASLRERKKVIDTLNDQLSSLNMTRDNQKTLFDSRQKELVTYRLQIQQATEIQENYQKWQDSRELLSEMDKIAEEYRQVEAKKHEPLQMLEAERARIKEEIKNLEVIHSTIIDDDNNIALLKSDINNLETQIHAHHEKIETRSALEEALISLQQEEANLTAENSRLKSEMNKMKERIDKLAIAEGAQCPLCNQPLSETDRQALIEQLNKDGPSLGDKFRDNQSAISLIRNQIDDHKKQIAELKGIEENLRIVTRKADQTRDQIEQITKRRAEWDNAKAAHHSRLKTILDEDTFLPDVRKSLNEINEALTKIAYSPSEHEQLKRFEYSNRDAEKTYNALIKAQSTLDPLEREVATLSNQLEQQNLDISKLQETYDLSVAQFAAEQAQLPDIQVAEEELRKTREIENQTRHSLGGAQQKVDVLDTIRKRKIGIKEERESTARIIEQLKMLERSFGKDGVPALLIEQALPEIEEQANTILARLSNNTMSVQFVTQREFKDASREDKKETLDIRISDGSGARDYEMFSGGESFRVNFAIRLALSRVLSQRAGAKLQTLVIDEGFGNQDAQGRQRLIQAINTVRDDFAKILIITHLEELKEAFPTRIEVTKTTIGSTLTVIG